MAESTALQSVPGGQIGSGTAQVFNPMQGISVANQAQRRQDMIDAYKAREENRRRALEAQARKQAQEEEVVAKYEVAQGDAFRRPVQEMIDARVARDKSEWNMLSKAQKMQRIADADNFTKAANQFISAQDTGFKAVQEKLKGDYNIPATVVRQLVDKTVKENPQDFYKRDFTPVLEETITKNPAYFNWQNAGKRLEEVAGTISTKTTNPSGTGGSQKYSLFLTGEKDKQTGLPIINRKVALDLIDKDPSARNMRDVFIATNLPKIQQQFPNLTPKQALEAAETEVINKFFQGRGVYDVTMDNQSTLGKAAQEAKGVRLSGLTITKEPSTADFRFTPASNVPGKPASQQTGRINFGTVTTFTTPETPIPINSNIRVFPLTDPSEALAAGLIEENPRGGYNLKLGGDVRSGQIVTARVFKRDVKSKNGYTVKKGTIVTDDYLARMTPKQRKEMTESIRAYRVTPNLMTSQLDDNTEQLLFKNPKVGIMDVLIPVSEAGNITSALKKEYEKPGKGAFNPFD